MLTVHTVAELQDIVQEAKDNGKRIGFVPTMGNLHEGHLKLVDTALAQSDFVVCSVFVNPMQFGANEDLDSYPRTLQEDQHKLSARKTNLLFAPSAKEMYPNGMQQHIKIDMPHMANVLCGKSRPIHFEGVCTVVTKLFNQVRPDVAVFGKKDLQQLLIIRQMTSDLCLPIKIVGADTEREQNGLAMSSRNSLLSPEEKQEAQTVNRVLQEIRSSINNGNRQYHKLLAKGTSAFEQTRFKADYLEIRDLSNFELAEDGMAYDNLGIFAAVFAEKTRLIDNTTTADVS